MLVLAALSATAPRTTAAPEYGTEVYGCGKENCGMIALTFDDGPHPQYTPEILDILKEAKIKATFFVIGENAAASPRLVDRIIEEGHEIGNHTYSHVFLDKKSEQEKIADIERCDCEIYLHNEYSARILRPPGGRYDSGLLRICAERGYDVVLWSVDTRDWTGASAEEIAHELLCNVKDGSIILMHDYCGRKSHTAEALRYVIPRLKEMGYGFATVSEIIE